MSLENRFGTMKEMIVTEIKVDGEKRFVAIDDQGLYLTKKNCIDSGLADINRYGRDRAVFRKQIEESGIDLNQLKEQIDQVLAVLASSKTETEVKIMNPLKASRRGIRL